MNIDEFGIIRDNSGAKIAVFKDPELGRKIIDRAALLSADEAAELINGSDQVQLKRVTMWEVV